MRNLITDVPGLLVGHCHDEQRASGVSAVIFEAPARASLAVHGGAPGVRDTALLEPERTVQRVDALVLSGGSAFGLDAMGGVQAWLRSRGRGYAVGNVLVPIVPGAILFDLLNGGDKDWGEEPFYWYLGRLCCERAAADFGLGSVGAGYGATTADLKGGLGSASVLTSAGFHVGALVAVNALGTATIGGGPHFWAAPYEQGREFGGLGFPSSLPPEALAIRLKGDGAAASIGQNTTIAIVATDADLTKAEAKHVAVMAHDGMARALRPAHAAMDGDLVFAAATSTARQSPSPRELTEIGALAADCLARAIARAIYEATALPFPGALPSWRDRFDTLDRRGSLA
ncbi:P1 family peptidase [Beijerinckia indica]|uniref:Peptidase S58 DmpA n=1 Tax=Beijerinckia indica subsp. indica (strain ATCC 9039 / DSM 1715 / NCIMB 8712) TaxID=395963 RepID=B2IJE2_BEII9|nr:P1 family peptidase [Beijerinckia indica]ACB96255.1 peptidase S58 DmpA [Beijerinckia indica subsp. indica ATCC 9039]